MIFAQKKTIGSFETWTAAIQLRRTRNNSQKKKVKIIKQGTYTQKGSQYGKQLEKREN